MEAFTEYGVVTGVINEMPQSQAEVLYPSGNFKPGETRTPTQVKDIPNICWSADSDNLYTLFMVDPDAPAPIGQVLHWLVVNIPGSDVSKGDHHVEYIGSGPPLGTGVHRYIFLVYKQTGKVDVSEPRVNKFSVEGRRSWNVQQWADKHGFSTPVAGNFYRAEYDDYVPTLHAQIGLKRKT